MIIIFVFSKNQKSQHTNKNIQKFKCYLPFFLSFIRMCVGTESKLYQVIIPFLPREWMLDARGRVLGSSLREIRCRINWRESLSTVKVTKVDQRNWGKNWEGFAVSFGTHEFRRSRVSRLGNDI